MLNKAGQEDAAKRVEELTYIDKYTKKKNAPLIQPHRLQGVYITYFIRQLVNVLHRLLSESCGKGWFL